MLRPARRASKGCEIGKAASNRALGDRFDIILWRQTEPVDERLDRRFERQYAVSAT